MYHNVSMGDWSWLNYVWFGVLFSVCVLCGINEIKKKIQSLW